MRVENNMDNDEKKEVEVVSQSAFAEDQGVETTVEPTDSQAPENDPEARIASLIEENEKLARDRDNYRSATLAMKGKVEVDEVDFTDPRQVAAFISKSVDEKLLETKEVKAKRDLEEYAKSLAKKNKELALALANKSGMGSASVGSGSSGMEVKTEYFSKEQLAEFKKRGWDEAKIKKAAENMKRQKV